MAPRRNSLIIPKRYVKFGTVKILTVSRKQWYKNFENPSKFIFIVHPLVSIELSNTDNMLLINQSSDLACNSARTAALEVKQARQEVRCSNQSPLACGSARPPCAGNSILLVKQTRHAVRVDTCDMAM